MIAMIGLSYVAGFLAFMLPSGVGVREGVLEGLLAPELAGRVAHGPAVATVTVLLLRLLWTGAELVMAAVVYWLPGPRTAISSQRSAFSEDRSCSGSG